MIFVCIDIFCIFIFFVWELELVRVGLFVWVLEIVSLGVGVWVLLVFCGTDMVWMDDLVLIIFI